jgi:hypothetical protein
MKRDLNLVLKILEYFETRKEVSIIQELKIEGYGDQVVKYHLRLMYQANFLSAEEVTSNSTKKRLIEIFPFELTWEGHEFLKSLHNKAVLKKVKVLFGKSLSDIPFTIIKEVALSIFRKEIGM